MHDEAYVFVRNAAASFPPPRSVVELGGLDFNGSVRGLFGEADYCGVDLVLGFRVDVVADAAEFTPEAPPDWVVCCEVLEHSPYPERIVANAIRMLKPGGVLVVTCAAPPRAPHSAVDGNALRPGEYYGNVELEAFRPWVEGLDVRHLGVLPRGDLQCLAVKP